MSTLTKSDRADRAILALRRNQAGFSLIEMLLVLTLMVILMVFVAQMAPWEALLIPMYVIARDTDMLDKLSMLTLVYFMTTLPFTIVTLRGSSRRINSPTCSARRPRASASRNALSTNRPHGERCAISTGRAAS